MGLEDLVGLFRERVHGLRGRLRRRLEGLRLEDLAPGFVRVRVGDFGREAAASQHHGDAMLGARPHGRPDAAEAEAVQGLREFLRPLADPARSAIRESHLLIDGREVPPEGDVALLQVNANPRRFEGTAAGVDLVRIVAEEGEMARVAARDDSGGDRIDEPIHAVRREPVEVRPRRRLERRLVAQFGERPIPEAVKDDQEDPPFVHVDAR
jgi:hypothetical protein